MEITILIALFLISVAFHEASHGFTAYLFGDRTAQEAGRLSLNPLRHIDLFWTLLLPIVIFITTHGNFAFGKAKPVPVNFSNLHHPKKDMIWVALAGPGANFVLAALMKGLWMFTGQEVFLAAVYFNLGLGLFNMLPVPPLDGSRVLAGLLPLSLAIAYLKSERFGFGIVILLYLAGLIPMVMMPMINFFCRIYRVPGIAL